MNVAAAGLVPSSLIFGCLVILSLHDCNIDCFILVFNKLVAYCLLNSQTDSTEPLIEHNGFYGPKAEKGQEVYVAGDKADLVSDRCQQTFCAILCIFTQVNIAGPHS